MNKIPCFTPTSSGPVSRALACLAPIMLAAMMLLALIPAPAWALDTAKCTARPNGSTGSEVYGGTETRVTWEGQADADEAITGLSIVFPQGTTFNDDTTGKARITLLTADQSQRLGFLDADYVLDGETFTATLDEPAQAGCYLRVEIYGVFFPVAGGEMALNGSYTLEDGTILPVEDIQPLAVTGVSTTGQITSWLSDQEWVQAWNSNRFLRMFLNPVIIVDSFPIVFQGFLMAVAIVAIAFPLAIPLGLCLSLMRMARLRVLRGIASVYVNVVRGTPLFLQIYIAFFGLPLAGLSIDKFPLGVIVLAMNSAAYLCEIFRAGIQSIPAGQAEAARSLGMNGAQTMVFVIIPQTVRRVIPTMTSEFILLYKDTSMLAAVGVMEVVMYAKTIVASTGSITPYIVAACFYLVITLPLAKVVGRLEARLAGGGRRRKHRGGPDAGEAKPLQGTDSAGVTAYVTDALTSQPVLKNDVPDAGR